MINLNKKFIILILGVLAFPIKANESEKSTLTQVGQFLFNNRRTIIPLVALIYYKNKASKDSILKVCALMLSNELITSIFSSDALSKNLDIWQSNKEDEYTRLPVLIQDKADCGYHAVKNGKYVYQMLAVIITNSNCLGKIVSSDSRIFPLEEWRNYILNKFRDNIGDGTNLSDEEIEDLIKNKADFKDINYIIIPNILDEESIGLDQNLTNIVELFRQESEKIQLFILGTMQHFNNQEAVKGTVGHWISIIAFKKNNKIKYYAMDSLASGNAIPVLFKKLKYLLENENLQLMELIPQLEQKITAIISNLSDAANKSGNNRLNNAMFQIQNIIEIFTTNNFRKNNTYVLKVKKILTTMEETLKDLTDEQKGWIEVELSLINSLQ